MSDLENHSFFAHFRSFALFERAKKEQLLICSFEKSAKKSDRSIPLLKRAEMSDEQMSELAIAQPCLRVEHSFILKMSDCKK